MIVNHKLVPVLCSLLKQGYYEEARCHAAGTIRNVISVQQAVVMFPDVCSIKRTYLYCAVYSKH